MSLIVIPTAEESLKLGVRFEIQWLRDDLRREFTKARCLLYGHDDKQVEVYWFALRPPLIASYDECKRCGRRLYDYRDQYHGR